ncbi:pentatricopeptide repeat-containing protein At1g71460, chloroplastic-like [Lotus japonicus]|uniref:pentatricopeptide repeat-containing protein At1g71460, chloroplastic-like n=1 Tax=Lotus japonicus TaxID=34305 RepID=UPI002582F878|nr:pentatricopeptide repeat-containing protein At1g71460, chloroplastic-like [Lotus japonicus]
MLFCVHHLIVVAYPCSKSSNQMQTSVSTSASLSLPLPPHSFPPIPNTFPLSNFKPLSLSSQQQKEPLPSPSTPPHTKPPHPNDPSSLIQLHFKRGNVDLARQVFEESPRRSVSAWNAMISGLAHNGFPREALEYVRLMLEEGKRPNWITMMVILPICAKLRTLKQGKEVHAYALKRRFLPHVTMVSSLMVMYSKCGVIGYSIRLFDGMEKKNVILWTAMIDSCVENGFLNEALAVMRSMQLTRQRADTVTLTRMLCVCGELRRVKLGKEVHGQVLKLGFASVHYVAAELINMYGACGVFDNAKLVFGAVPDKGSMTWTALIRAYGYKEWYREAIDLFDLMMSNGCSPNTFTFEAVLSICDRAGFVEDAFRFFDLMSTYEIEASKEHCTFMVQLLTRYGKLDEAQRFLEMSPSL